MESRLYAYGLEEDKVPTFLRAVDLLGKRKDKNKIIELHEQVINYAEKIKDKNIKFITNYSINTVDSKWWIDPCSSSGKHHPPENQGLGGIVRHSIKTAEIALELARFYDLEDKKDQLISAALLHDLDKYGIPWKDKTDYRHGYLTYKKLTEIAPARWNVCLDQETLDAIRYHMGRWVKRMYPEDGAPEEVEKANQREVDRALNATVLEKIIQLSDYFASRKSASWMPNIPIIDSKKYKKIYG
jgi:HD superfamily phosphohydrolase YqeK